MLVINLEDLELNNEISVDLKTHTIRIHKSGNLKDNLVSFVALYSFMKHFWLEDNKAGKYEFPFYAISNYAFLLHKDWSIIDEYNLLRMTKITEPIIENVNDVEYEIHGGYDDYKLYRWKYNEIH